MYNIFDTFNDRDNYKSEGAIDNAHRKITYLVSEDTRQCPSKCSLLRVYYRNPCGINHTFLDTVEEAPPALRPLRIKTLCDKGSDVVVICYQLRKKSGTANRPSKGAVAARCRSLPHNRPCSGSVLVTYHESLPLLIADSTTGAR